METTYPSLEEAENLARFLKDEINKLGADKTDRPTWTRAVHESLDQYRVQRHWSSSEVLPPWNKTLPEDSRRDTFLLDFVIWRRDIDGNKEGAWVACESEWNIDSKSVIEDFQKLLSFRAPYKVMVYDAGKNERNADRCRKEFRSLFANFRWHTEDEIYIFIEFVKGNLVANCYTWTTKNPAEFMQVPDKNS